MLPAWRGRSPAYGTVRVTTLEAICRALDCRPGDLLQYVAD
jgi:DNA-binding Xre family transcriptional regulator